MLCSVCYRVWPVSAILLCTGVPATDDPRQVVVVSIAILVDGRADMVYPLGTPEDVARLATTPIVFKEGEDYRIRITFRVNHEIVSGLKFAQWVYKMKLRGAASLDSVCSACLFY